MTADVDFLVPRRVDATLRYQRYYLLGLEELARVRWRGAPPPLRLVPGSDRRIRAEAQLQRGLARVRRPATTGHVGRYVVRVGGQTVRVAIDAHDARTLRDPDAAAADDLYFKSNLWPEDDRRDNVHPIVNGNGMLGRGDLAYLRSLRDRPKDVDLVFVSRVWGGREHNLRLFEEVAKLPIRSELHAIFPVGTPQEELADGTRRLRAAGVRVGTEDVPARALWDMLSRARLVLFRAGKHLCIPWRAIDLLCMGACVVLDAPFEPQWPVPLRPGVHYLDCGLERPVDTSPAPDDQYARVAATITDALRDPGRLEEIRRSNAAYYDAHASPERVATYMLERVASLS